MKKIKNILYIIISTLIIVSLTFTITRSVHAIVTREEYMSLLREEIALEKEVSFKLEMLALDFEEKFGE